MREADRQETRKNSAITATEVSPEVLVLPVCKHCRDEQYLLDGELLEGTFLLLQHVKPEIASVFMDLHQETYHDPEGLERNFVLYSKQDTLAKIDLATVLFNRAIDSTSAVNVSVSGD